MAINPSGIPTWMAFRPQLLIHPSYDVVSQNYQRFRIPRPPEPGAAGSTPGMICWGTVGAMPTAQPAPTVDFNVNTETSRKSEDVRIENPDDPSQYVIANRPKEITFNAVGAAAPPGPNTASQEPAGLADFADDADTFEGWSPVANGYRPTHTITYRYETVPQETRPG